MPEASGNTPLDPEEVADLIPSLISKEELNEWESENILQARIWATSPRRLKRIDLFSEAFLRALHSRMFDRTWRWAGSYRKTEKNIGVQPILIVQQLAVLLGDARFWLEHRTYDSHELCVRFHHKLVWIHPFPNGNGRHARMMADLISIKLGSPELTWGRQSLVQVGEAREAYLAALRTADLGDFTPLLRFALD